MPPADTLPKPEGWKFTRAEAWDRFCCACCGRHIHPALSPTDNIQTWHHVDRDEYWISGLCPKCWDVVMAEGEE